MLEPTLDLFDLLIIRVLDLPKSLLKSQIIFSR